MRQITYREAIREALMYEMHRDSTVFIAGEDIGVMGGANFVTEGFLDEFGSERVKDTPISETAIVGLAVGSAAAGLRPCVDITFMDFIGI